MRIGELLLQRGWVAADALERAVRAQHPGGTRLCSLLIQHGGLDPDHASRALGDQRGVAAVLQKHLAFRDRTLAPLLPARLARACVALPIGRVGDGSLLICMRDPRPEVAGAIRRAVVGPVALAIAPAAQLEQLVALTYPADAVPEVSFDVDLRTGPIQLFDDLGSLDTLTLVELDDTGVSRDPSQSPSYIPPSNQRKR